jgi:hypothetical protein
MLLVSLPLFQEEAKTPPSPEPTAIELLWEASKRGEVGTIQKLIETGVDIDATTEFNATAIYFAAANNHSEACRVLAQAGAKLDVSDNFYGNNAMGMAGWLGYPEVVRVLMKQGSQAASGAFFAAVNNGHLDVVDVILSEQEFPPPVLDQAWQSAMGTGHAQVAARLVEAGANPPSESSTESNPAAASADRDELNLPAVVDRYVPVVDPASWSGFRGNGSDGNGDGQHPPLTWNRESGRNIRWETKVPGLGHSSPVVWGNRVFITTAVGEKPHTGLAQHGPSGD